MRRGTTSASLADVKPTVHDGTDVKFTLTPDIIHSIFIQYPNSKKDNTLNLLQVHKAYKEQVPDIQSEKQFWKSYFQSKFFHRTRGQSQPNDKLSDIFENYKEDDLGVESYFGNKVLDLTMTDTEKVIGNRADVTMRGGDKLVIPLIRKFNRHSEIVLKSGLKRMKRDWTGNDIQNAYLEVCCLEVVYLIWIGESIGRFSDYP